MLEDFNLAAAPGELVAVAGANGAGKSTALKLLAGLIHPVSGDVRLDARALKDYSRAELGRRIAYLPQDRTVHWGISAGHVVALGRLPHKSYSHALSAKDHAAIDAAMTRMDVTHLKDRSVARLSGGERARVLVARALAQEADFLIADEPAAGFDPAHALSAVRRIQPAGT